MFNRVYVHRVTKLYYFFFSSLAYLGQGHLALKHKADSNDVSSESDDVSWSDKVVY